MNVSGHVRGTAATISVLTNHKQMTFLRDTVKKRDFFFHICVKVKMGSKNNFRSIHVRLFVLFVVVKEDDSNKT